MWTNVQKFVDEKEHVTKFVFEKADIAIEAVLYRYPTYEERTVLCISTMCGCPMGCRFCGTGDYFVRSLTAEEIVGQARYILETQIDGQDPTFIKKLQIMVMSMGEPAMVKSLYEAFAILHSEYPNAALLISSSGPDVDYEWMMQMAENIPTVGLQFSVHESTDAARNELIPFKKKLSLDAIAKVGIEFYERTGRSPFFNYCAHEKNTSDEDVTRLVALFDPRIWCATVSVVCERDSSGFDTSNETQRSLATDFAAKLVSIGYDVRVFDPAGQDTIGGGCGQLWFTQKWMSEHPEFTKQSIGYGREKKHIPICRVN